MEQLFDRHSTAIYSVAKRILQAGPSAEDVMNEIFIQIWREPATFLQTDGDLRNRFIIISQNISIVVLRDRVSKGLEVAARMRNKHGNGARRSAMAKAILTVSLSDEQWVPWICRSSKSFTVSEIAKTGPLGTRSKEDSLFSSPITAFELDRSGRDRSAYLGGSEVNHAPSHISK